MKVVHIITRLDLGGAQRNTLYTVSHLDPARFEVVLAAGPGGKLDREALALAEDPQHPFRIKWFPELLHPIHPVCDIIALFQIFQFFKREAPDIVHTHSSKAGILGRLAAWMAGVPIIVHTYHGFGIHGGQNAALCGFLRLLERMACAMSSRVIFVSEENRKAANDWRLAKVDREVLIRSGVRLADYPARILDRGAKKASLGCGMHKTMIVSVGNLKPQKNPEGFVRVAAKAVALNPDLRFVFVGDGGLRSGVEALVIAHELYGKVFFPGWREDVPEILAAADIFVLTSLWEGLPRALVEAMKTGLPCVCFAADGIRDLIHDGQNGFLAPINDEDKIASLINELARDPDRAKAIGQAAAASIGKQFDIDEMVRQQESLYAQLFNDLQASANLK